MAPHATTEAPPPKSKKSLAAAASLAVSAYDRAASLVVALLVLLGTVVFCLLMAWLSSGIFHYQRAVPVVMEEFGGGIESGEGTEGQEIQAPEVGEIARESNIAGQPLPDTLAAVVDVAATRASDVEQFDRTQDRNVQEGGGSSRGTGDRPAKGTGGGAGGGHGHGLARPQRWEIRFPEGNTVETYARQLDFFGIELGVLGASNEVIYLSKLSSPVPTVRTSPRTSETRMYMTWSRGDLDQADRELFARAKVDVAGRIILKFIPQETEKQLGTVEQQYKNRPSKDIRRTRFSIKPQGQGFAFFVTDQEYY
ncbi:MAG: hypothetical protein HYX69_00550 [Planctomycetia bacterium]|nr:hypothetical protein [Planctomycetia bacterium]